MGAGRDRDAVDDDGLHQFDAAGQSDTPRITGITLSGDTLSWSDYGVPHQVTLS